MQLSYSELRNRTMCLARKFAVPTFSVALVMVSLSATANAAPESDAAASAASKTYHSIYLTDITDQNDLADTVTDLRNMFPRTRIYYVSSRNVISMMCTDQEYQEARQIVADLSHGPQIFRLTYTFTGVPHGPGSEAHSASVVVASGDSVTFKHGTKVPLVTGGDVTSKSPSNEQIQYLDLGLNIYASLSGPADDLRLRSRITESALAPGKPDAPSFDPVIRQTVLNGNTVLAAGKPQILGSVDMPGSGQREQVEVTAEPVQ